MQAELMPRSTLITPNIPEAEVLAGETIRSWNDLLHAGEIMRERFPQLAMLMKGGHLLEDGYLQTTECQDVLVHADGHDVFSREYIRCAKPLHGTGCTLSSAIAANLALGQPFNAAIDHALGYVHDLIEQLPGDIGTAHRR